VPSEPHRWSTARVRPGWATGTTTRCRGSTRRPTGWLGRRSRLGSTHAGNLVVGAGDLWVTSDYRANAAAEDVVVVRIGPQSNREVETITVDGHPIDVAAAGVRSGCRSRTPARSWGSPPAERSSEMVCRARGLAPPSCSRCTNCTLPIGQRAIALRHDSGRNHDVGRGCAIAPAPRVIGGDGDTASRQCRSGRQRNTQDTSRRRRLVPNLDPVPPARRP
jgi:hypothetical protein